MDRIFQQAARVLFRLRAERPLTHTLGISQSLLDSLRYILTVHYRATEFIKVFRGGFTGKRIEDSYIIVRQDKTGQDRAAWETGKEVLSLDWFHRA